MSDVTNSLRLYLAQSSPALLAASMPTTPLPSARLTTAVFGGTSNLIGPLVGSFTLSVLPELMSSLKDFRLAANGLILIIVILYLPKGICDPARFRQLRRRFQSSKVQ